MKYVLKRSKNKLRLVLSFILLIGFIVASPAKGVESLQYMERKDPATAIANICAALLKSCTRQPLIYGLKDTPSITLLVDLYKYGVADIIALNLEVRARYNG